MASSPSCSITGYSGFSLTGSGILGSATTTYWASYDWDWAFLAFLPVFCLFFGGAFTTSVGADLVVFFEFLAGAFALVSLVAAAFPFAAVLEADFFASAFSVFAGVLLFAADLEFFWSFLLSVLESFLEAALPVVLALESFSFSFSFDLASFSAFLASLAYWIFFF